MTEPMSPRERAIRQRLKSDFPHYALKCLKIRTKDGPIEALGLNAAQLHIHERIERQRQETGRVRALIVKGRQQGCSTYVEGRFFWKVTHRRGAKAFILSHHDDATGNLFDMAKRFYDHCPAMVRPILKASNAKELVFKRLESGYAVATAGSKGAGRSDTIQLFHGSEVPYWANAEDHVAGALQAVPNADGTEVILEGTSAGPAGLFYKMCQAALKGGGEYILIFTPWFWQPEYRLVPPQGFTPTSEEAAYAEIYDLDDGQLFWRRVKIIELNGVQKFRREYPATVEEAFKAGAEGALWQQDLIDGTRVSKVPEHFKRVVVAIDPSGGDGPQNDEVGIVAAGLGMNDHGYVLEDVSGRYTPAGWAAKAIALANKWGADRIIGEKNFGGDMVEHTLRTVDKNVAYKGIVSSRGKALRAEPISSAYERGQVHHVGTHIALEDEMISWDPIKSTKSPNRLDANVFALTELMDGPGLLNITSEFAAQFAAASSMAARRR